MKPNVNSEYEPSWLTPKPATRIYKTAQPLDIMNHGTVAFVFFLNCGVEQNNDKEAVSHWINGMHSKLGIVTRI